MNSFKNNNKNHKTKINTTKKVLLDQLDPKKRKMIYNQSHHPRNTVLSQFMLLMKKMNGVHQLNLILNYSRKNRNQKFKDNWNLNEK